MADWRLEASARRRGGALLPPRELLPTICCSGGEPVAGLPTTRDSAHP